MFTWLNIGAGAVAGALLVGVIAVPLAHRNGVADGRAGLQAEIATAAAKAEKERVSDYATLSKLSDHDLCVRALRSRGMPISGCASL